MTREEKIERGVRDGYTYAYGSLFKPHKDAAGRVRGPQLPWQIEAHILRADKPWGSLPRPYGKLVLEDDERPKEYMGYVEHLKRFISLIWHEKNTMLAFEWNPNACRIVEELFVEGRKFLGIAGHKSSSKTETLAVLCVALFLIDPTKTKCIATSYTLQTGEGKIWGRIKLAWHAACEATGGETEMPGKLRDSEGKIVYKLPNGHFDDTRGIELIAGEQSKTKKSSARLQGVKAKLVFIAADELATLSHAIVKTCKENVATSNDNVKFAGSFNPDNYYDGAMEVAKPKAGWGSITVDSEGWETELGYCIHFDGLKSPNVVAGRIVWKGLYNREQCRQDTEWYGGEKTAGFWMMIRAFWSPDGKSDAIYSGQEIERYHGDRGLGKGWWWVEPPTKVAGLDPAYRPGGDRAAAYAGEVGQAEFEDRSRRLIFHFTEYKILCEDVTRGTDKPRQVAEAFRDFCEERGILVQNTGVDCTGAAAFGSLLRMVWADGFSEIIFSESPSDAPISDTEHIGADKRYGRRDAELWYSGKVLLRSQQIKGIHPDMADEMCNRTCREIGDKIYLEKKEDMKARTGKSPDIADAGFCCLDVARQKFGLASTEKARKGSAQEMSESDFMKWVEQIQGCRNPYLQFEAA